MCFISRNNIKPENMSNIKFNPLQIEKYQYYDEGIKHLNKDVKCFSERFKNLEDKVKQFNTTIDKFQNDKLIELVKNILRKMVLLYPMIFQEINDENTVVMIDLLPSVKIILERRR